MSRVRMRKEYKKIVDPLLSGGWDLIVTGGTHFRLSPPKGSVGVSPIYFGVSPSDRRAIKNFEAAVRRALRVLEGA